jgi:hypothetical protein
LIPAGRLAVTVQLFVLPVPAFGPGSVEYARKRAEELEIGGDVPLPGVKGDDVEIEAKYIGAGAYF